jgi:CHAT domain-containing protein
MRLRRKGDLESAVQYFGQAIDSLELQISRLGSTGEVRAEFRARNVGFYRDYIDALLDAKLAQKERAFGILERSRARSFLDTLAERDIVFSQDLPSDLKRAQRTNAADNDRTQAELSELNPVTDKEHLDKVVAHLRELSEERAQIIERIRHASPRLASLQYPQPLDLTATRQALDPGTTLLSYSVGTENTTLFVVQPAGTDPGLTVVSVPTSEKELRSQVDLFRHLLERPGESSRAALVEQGRKLYDLLIRPVDLSLTESKRLLIVPDGPLHSLPFAALLRNEHQYLVEWKPLHQAVSATVYSELRKMRRTDNNGAVEVAAFGDPRYPATESKQAEETRNLELRSALEDGFRFGRLVFSRGEVNSICELYAGHCQKYLGAEATEERAKSLDKRTRYVHFATHAYLDEKLPLNSAVVLSIPDKLAEGQENGLLQAWEIFDQVRLDADLVVLSACKTALGQEVNGEGLIGLTRAFHYAGARSVVASLWNVEDFRTAGLMQDFYGRLREGKTKDEALREAQLKLLHARSSSHPYYWAAFTISGDWR